MKDIFAHDNYRNLFRYLMESPPYGGRGVQTRLAEMIGCQQAFLSRILKGQADLSPEQAIRVAVFFKLNRLEREYWLNLINENRAGNLELKSYFKEKLEQILEENRSLHKRIKEGNPITEVDKALYYSDWYFQALHMLLGVPGHHTADSLAAHLGLSQSIVDEALQILLRLNLAKQEGREYAIADGRMHLPPTHPLVRKHHTNWRLHAMQRLSNPTKHDMHYTSVMTCSEADREKVKAILAEAVTQIRELVKHSKDEIACHYAVDIYDV